MAGEYAFSLGLSFALVFLGLAVRGMRTGRYRAAAAVVLAVCILCHLLTAFFALAGALVIFVLAGPTRKRLWWMVASVGGGLLLVSWWAVPFVARPGLRHEHGLAERHPHRAVFSARRESLGHHLGRAGDGPGHRRGRHPAAVGTAPAGRPRRRRPRSSSASTPSGRSTTSASSPSTCSASTSWPATSWPRPGWPPPRGVRRLRLALWRDAVRQRHGPGAARRSRLRPWRRLVGPVPRPRRGRCAGRPPGAEVGPRAGPAPWPRPRFGPWAPGAVTVPVVAMLGALLAVVLPPSSPGWTPTWARRSTISSPAARVASWAQWNYSGYQNTPGAKELYDGIIPTMERVGRRHGCGRAMWEYNSNLNRFGTPESLMLLPYWTNNCIDSIEGVLFESSATTPYHFLNQAELSAAPSEAVVAATTGLQYGALDVALGVKHLQLLGIKYFMASSPSVQAQAAADPALTPGGDAPVPGTPIYQGQAIVTTWKVYEVARLRHGGAAHAGRPTSSRRRGAGQGSWLPVAQQWYADPARWSQQLVVGGLASWARTTTRVDAPAGHGLSARCLGERRQGGTDTLSFHVNRTGVPVAVAISYFPNWQATGRAGPWRAEPNLMVVDPTSHTVTLTYGATGADHLGLVLTIVGLLRPSSSSIAAAGRLRRRLVTASAAHRTPDRGGGGDRLSGAMSRPRRRLQGLRRARHGPRPARRPRLSGHRLGLRPLRRGRPAGGGPGHARLGGGPVRPPSSPGPGRRAPTVVDIGLASTDTMYFASGRLDAPGAMFTASHNPAAYNGIKFCLAGAKPVGQDTRPGPDPRGRPRRRWPAGPTTASAAGRLRAPGLPVRVRRPRPFLRRSSPPCGPSDRGRHRQRDGGPRRPRGLRRAPLRRVTFLFRRARRDLPQPPGRSHPAREPRRPAEGRPRARGRRRPGLRRRRRPGLPGRREGRGGLRVADHRPRGPGHAGQAPRARPSSTT